MNIFYLDHDPVIAAQSHHDKHCIKMILESAQMLSTAHRMIDGNTDTRLYKKAFPNHPCTKWVRANKKAYMYTYRLFRALCDEYTHRYGKIHKTDSRLNDVVKNPPENIPNTEWVNPPQAMPEIYRNKDPVQAYKNYYINEKVKLSRWTKRIPPNWTMVI